MVAAPAAAADMVTDTVATTMVATTAADMVAVTAMVADTTMTVTNAVQGKLGLK